MKTPSNSKVRFVNHTACWIFLVCLLAAGLLSSPRLLAQGFDKLYGQEIIVPANTTEELDETAEVLKGWLNQMTGQEFTVRSGEAKRGIILALADSEFLPEEGMEALQKAESKEAFLIQGGADKLWIVGKTDLAIERGIYWYLDKLGCRWLHPNGNWTIIPKRDDIQFQGSVFQEPAFIVRDFFGTGGFGRPARDPKQRSGDEWNLYKRENLLGGAVKLGGHAGEAFLLRQKEELLQHPEYLAKVDGVREILRVENEGPTQIFKLCSSNPGLQELWVKDRLDAFRTALEKDPSLTTISVEPADGGGHCECVECQKLGTVSDQVFTLANLVARAVAEEFPGKYVNLYAYNKHAAPPNIPLEPNMIVSIVPYGFQTTGMSPEEFIVAWGKKTKNLAMYDYWNIPDWSRNLPDFSTDDVVDRIRLWNENGVKYFAAESTFCGGSMGPNWYLGARLLWDPTQDENAILDDYYQQAFGPAQAPVRTMYDRWGDNFVLSDHELALSFRNLREAMALIKDPAITARLVDLGRYVHYMRLWKDYLDAPRNSEERVKAAKAVVNYVWRIYDTNMVQAFRVAQLLNRDEKPDIMEDVHMDNEMWVDVPQLTDAEIVALVDDGVATFKPLDFEAKSWDSKLVPLADAISELSEETVETNPFGFSSNFEFAVPKGITTVPLEIIVNTVSGPGKSDRIKVTGPDGKEAFAIELPNTAEWAEIVIPTPAPGTYSMAIIDQKNTFRLRVPRNLPFVGTGPLTSTDLSPRTWFYVPPGTEKIAIHSPGVIPIEIFDPDGGIVDVTANDEGENVFLVEVRAGESGKCWSFKKFKAWTGFQLLNCPNVFAWSEEGMMVPEELQKKGAGR